MSDQAAPGHIPVYPIEFSAHGKNAYYHFCHIRGGQQSFAVCRNIMKAIDDGRLSNDQFVDCQRACTRGDCDARKMHAEEISVGHALYYKERTNLNPANAAKERPALETATSSGKYGMKDEGYARGWAAGAGSKSSSGQEKTRKTVSVPVQPKPVAKPKPSGFVTEDMADLVNVLMKPTEQKTTPPSPASIKPEPGESPLAFAKRRAQAIKESQ